MKVLLLGIALLLAASIAADVPQIQPGEFAAQMAANQARAAVFYVGPNVLYRGKHIPGAVYAGPAGRAEGLELLKQTVDKLPRDREIVLYCGCCPWDHCPNMKPATELLKQMGFTHAKVMYIENSFAKDWIDKGYPVEAGTSKQ